MLVARNDLPSNLVRLLPDSGGISREGHPNFAERGVARSNAGTGA